MFCNYCLKITVQIPLSSVPSCGFLYLARCPGPDVDERPIGAVYWISRWNRNVLCSEGFLLRLFGIGFAPIIVPVR